MKRRTFLQFSSASLASMLTGATGYLAWQPRAEAATITKTFYITDGYIKQPDGKNVYFRGFSNSSGSLNVPGDAIIAQENDTVRITIVNTLGTSHNFTVQGQGVSVSIPAGGQKTVEFIAKKPGSYLYYDASNAPYNRVVGLHGGLAVMPQGSSNELYDGSRTFKKQLFWVFNDIDPAWNDRIRTGSTPSTAFKPRYFTINGLSGRPPGAPGYTNPAVNGAINARTQLHGKVGDRTLIRLLNAGMCDHSVHWHGNHVEWLSRNGQVRSDVWNKDVLYLPRNLGRLDAIFPFHQPPDAWPKVSKGHYVMHLHDEMTQTAGGGLYQFGAMAHIEFV